MKSNLSEQLNQMICISKQNRSFAEQMAITAGVIWIAVAFSKKFDDCCQAVNDWVDKQGFSVCRVMVKSNAKDVYSHYTETYKRNAGKDYELWKSNALKGEEKNNIYSVKTNIRKIICARDVQQARERFVESIAESLDEGILEKSAGILVERLEEGQSVD